MSLFYDLSIGTILPNLHNLTAVLKKASAHSVPTSDLCNHRLIADMQPFTFQINRILMHSLMTAHHLGGVPLLELPQPTTFDEMHTQIDTAIAHLEKVKPEDMEGKDKEVVTVKVPIGELKFTGLDYFRQFAEPNFWFHWATAYDLLRAQGVPLGKRDFLGKLNLL